MSSRSRFVAASASFRSLSQREREPDSGVSNPTRRYVWPLARTVSPSTTVIDAAPIVIGEGASIDSFNIDPANKTPNAAKMTEYLMSRYRDSPKIRVWRYEQG